MDFIIRELNKDYSALSNCTQVCSSQYSISGLSNFCTSATYTIANLPTGATVQWAVSGNATTPGSTNGSITLNANGAGAALLGATINSNCSINTLNNINIAVGLQTLMGNDVVDRTPQASKYVYVTSTVTQITGTTTANYTWYQEVNNAKGPQIGSGLQLTNYPIPPGSVLYFRCEAITSCGTSIYRSYAYNTNSPSAMLAADYTIYPNPAQSSVNVIAPADNTGGQTANAITTNAVTSPEQPRVFDAYIISDKGIKLRVSKNNKQAVKFDISDIPNGLYFVHIYENGKLIKKELIITR